MNNLSYIINVLYKLKQDYGFPIDIYRFTSQNVNTTTGSITKTRIVINIPLAVILTEQDARKFSYSRAFIAENRAFTFGGFYDIGTRVCILDAQDLPGNFTPQLDDYFVSEETRYQVSKVGKLMGDFGFLVAMKETKGLEPFQILDQTLCSTLCLKQNTRRL